MVTINRSNVVFSPTAHQAMLSGINQVAQAIRPTFGPLPRRVAIDPGLDRRMPEILDSGGAIARRIIQLADRDADVGAMFVRDFLWRLQENAGDGTATAVILFQKIYTECLRFLAAGGNSSRLRVHLEKGLGIILRELNRMTLPLEGRDRLAQVAYSVCHDQELAHLLGEIFDILGVWGRLEIRTGRGRELEREFVEGSYWEKGLVSTEMIADRGQLRTDLENAAILISDLEIEEPQQLFPAMVLALEQKIPGLLIVAKKFSPKVIGFLLSNRKPEIFQVIAVNTPGAGQVDQAMDMEDLAVLTGGRPFLTATGDSFNRIRPEDLGRARRIWANQYSFGIAGGKGNPGKLRQQITALQAAFEHAEQPEQEAKLRKRIGTLLGGSITLWVGGTSGQEIEARKENARRTAITIRRALLDGLLPGGGTSLLACREALCEEKNQEPEARAAFKILSKAMAEPMRTLIANSGGDVSAVMAEVELGDAGCGYEIHSERVVNMLEAGILDTAAVQKLAVQTAVQSAALAVTVDVIVHPAELPGKK